MKRLFVLRHAKAVGDQPGLADFDRPINARGRADAEAVGREMRLRSVAPDAVCASPAARVAQTLEHLAKGYGRAFDVCFDRRIYDAPSSDLIERVRAAGAGAESLLLVGHNPGLQELIVELAADQPLRAEISAKFPTAALAELQFDVDDWRGVARAMGRIAALIRPRELGG